MEPWELEPEEIRALERKATLDNPGVANPLSAIYRAIATAAGQKGVEYGESKGKRDLAAKALQEEQGL